MSLVSPLGLALGLVIGVADLAVLFLICRIGPGGGRLMLRRVAQAAAFLGLARALGGPALIGAALGWSVARAIVLPRVGRVLP